MVIHHNYGNECISDDCSPVSWFIVWKSPQVSSIQQVLSAQFSETMMYPLSRFLQADLEGTLCGRESTCKTLPIVLEYIIYGWLKC